MWDIVYYLAGVGMLIHQLVKAHKEKMAAEENPAAAGISVTPTTDFFQCAIASYADIVVVQGAHHNAGSRYVYIGTRHPPSFKS